jgi:hypothetical protein
VEEERKAGTLSLNSRLTILEVRLDRLKAFGRRGWKPTSSADEQRQFLAEIDRLDGVLTRMLQRALR